MSHSQPEYARYLTNPAWQSRPPLSRVLLGARRSLGVKLKVLAELVAPGDPGAASAIAAFEHKGGPIRREMFESLVAALGVDVVTVHRLILERRHQEEEQYRVGFLGLPNRLVIPFAPTTGYTKVLPESMSLNEAQQRGAALAREHRCPVNLYFDHRYLFQFDRSGLLIRSRELAGWSSYPFGETLSAEAIDDALA